MVPLTSGCRGRVPVCAHYPPKVRDGTGTLRCRIFSVTYRNNNLRSSRERATQLLQLGGVSILLLFQVP